jgi:hypothetical protein
MPARYARWRSALGAAPVLLLAFALDARALTIFESATLGSSSTTNKGDVSSSQSFGVRFELTAAVQTTEIGGHFLRANTSGNQLVYGAVVALSGPTDFPDSTSLTTSDVIGFALLGPLTSPSSEVSAELELVLTPGWYALVYGSGGLGASGFGGIVEADTDVGSPDYFRQTFGTWTETFPPNDQRFFLKGIVPEPATALLLGLGLAALAAPRPG